MAGSTRRWSRTPPKGVKAPEKVGAAVSRVLSRHHGHRYYGWELKEGKLHYFEHSNLEREKAYEGKYLIQTEPQDYLTMVENKTGALFGAACERWGRWWQSTGIFRRMGR